MKVIIGEEELKFTVYRKTTNKNDFTYFNLAHDKKTKSMLMLVYLSRP